MQNTNAFLLNCEKVDDRLMHFEIIDHLHIHPQPIEMNSVNPLLKTLFAVLGFMLNIVCNRLKTEFHISHQKS